MPGERQQEAAQEPTHDAFGAPLKPEAPPVVEPEKKPEGEAKKPDFDLATHPVVLELQQKVKDQADQLSGQGKLIRRLKKGAKESAEAGEGGTNEDFKPPYPDIKRSKDLTEAERDEMTANEIKLMDEKADLQEKANKDAEAAFKRSKEQKDPDDDGGEEPEEVEDHHNEMVATEIDRLANGDKERKRELTEAAKLISFAGLKTREQIAERMKLAMKLIPEHQPPKERQTANGAAVKEGGKGDDPFGTDAIVREARAGSSGAYAL